MKKRFPGCISPPWIGPRPCVRVFWAPPHADGFACFADFVLQPAQKAPKAFCHSERSEESLLLFMGLNRREIPRSARNDKINYFFCSLFDPFLSANAMARIFIPRRYRWSHPGFHESRLTNHESPCRGPGLLLRQ